VELRGARDLAHDVRQRIAGERFDDGSRALYATDASNCRRLVLRGDFEVGLKRRRFWRSVPQRRIRCRNR